MQNNKKNKTSLRSFNMKQATSQIFTENSVVTSLAGNSLNNTSNLTMSFPSCPTENLCVGLAYIPNYSDLSTMQIYVNKRSLTLDDSVNINNITQLDFSCFSNITFGITYNEKESEETYYNTDIGTFGWEVFDVTENADILNNTLKSVQKGLIIPQIEYITRLNNFNIYSPNVILK